MNAGKPWRVKSPAGSESSPPPHEGGVGDVLGDLAYGPGAVLGTKPHLAGRDAAEFRDDAAAGVGPGVECFFEE